MNITIKPEVITNENALEDLLSQPYPQDIEFAESLDGDVMVLGAGGKMGPTLIQRICRAREQAGASWKVCAVSRFSDPAAREKIEAVGAETISADLLDEQQLESLPDCPNLIYMVGMKFGATGQEPLTWAMNAYLPGRVADRFASSRITAFSTGNIYPLVPVESGGSKETDRPDPVGEYAQSCLGRERVLEHFSLRNTTPMCLIRLNYAVEARYGVLLDIALKVYEEQPVSLKTGYVNVIWQGDANSVAFRSLNLCASPAEILNVTGPDILSVRSIAEGFGKRFGKEPEFSGTEQTTALLNDAGRCHEIFGQPKVDVEEVMDLIARWITIDGKILGKPTKFEVRDGQF